MAGLTSATSQAFMHNMPMPGPDLFVSSMLTQRALQKKLVNEAARQPQPPALAALPRFDGSVDSAQRIAAHYPAQHRAAAERLFSDLLIRYRQLARQLGQPPDDLGAAVAALVAASYMVYQRTDFPDAQFPALAQQMRAALRDSPDIQALSPAQRLAMVEEVAILAMLLAGTKLAMANAADHRESEAIAMNMRSSAKAWLERWVDVDADRVEISTSGLRVRPL